MAKYVKGDAVPGATSYELFENVDGTYTSLATGDEINFNATALGLAEGDHILVAKAHADGFTSSAYSNEVIYSASYTEHEYETNLAYYNEAKKAPSAAQTSSTLYVSTEVFTRETLPVGSQLILANSSYRYRKCNWLEDAVLEDTTLRGEAVTAVGTTVVTEDFWGDFTYIAFNIYEDDLAEWDADTYADDVREVFKIMLPDA